MARRVISLDEKIRKADSLQNLNTWICNRTYHNNTLNYFRRLKLA